MDVMTHAGFDVRKERVKLRSFTLGHQLHPAVRQIPSPTSKDPVKVTIRTSGCPESASPISEPGPVTTLRAWEGNPESRLLQDAMAYQISKEIGAMATVLAGELDAILITGGMAHNPDLTAQVKKRVDFIAPVLIFPGEDEMRALAQNGSLLLRGKISARLYGEQKDR